MSSWGGERGPLSSRRGGAEPGGRPAGSEVESVSEFTARLRQDLARRFGHAAVLGEIGEWTRATSGHVYFSLKDSTARLSAVLWRSTAQRVAPRDLALGTEVLAIGRVDVYAPRGTYSLVVDRLEIAGRGDLHLRFERLKEELRERGWFDLESKKALPLVPRGIGVVTSPGGAALQDFLDTLRKRFDGIPVKVWPARVQGEGAAAEIARGVRALDRRADLDVLVVTRGGGSLEDLWAFNEEVVARAIHEARLPVVCGVGHETDVTIADLVADVRAKTPTEAAILVVPARVELEERIRGLGERLQRILRHRLELLRREVEALGGGRALGRPEQQVLSRARDLEACALHLRHLGVQRIARAESAARGLEARFDATSPRRRLAWDRGRVDDLGTRLVRAAGRLGPIQERALAEAAALLEAHSPVKTMARGFSVALRAGEKQPLTSLGALAPGDELETILLDGTVRSRVEGVEAREPLR